MVSTTKETVEITVDQAKRIINNCYALMDEYGTLLVINEDLSNKTDHEIKLFNINGEGDYLDVSLENACLDGNLLCLYLDDGKMEQFVVLTVAKPKDWLFN